MTDQLPSLIKLDPARIESRKRLEQMHPADRFKAMFGHPFTPPTNFPLENQPHIIMNTPDNPHNPFYIAVDFDGTCVTHEYPKVGRYIGAEPVLKRLVAEGAKLILWTMRSDEQLKDAIRWFEEREISLYGIQRNPTQDSWTSSPKAYAKIYIDDAALGCPLCPGLKGERPFVDWNAVAEYFWPTPANPPASQTKSCPQDPGK